MITSQEAYKRFLLKVNKNDTNRNVKIPKSVFVLLYNSEQPEWLGETIDAYENSSNIDYLADLLTPPVKLVEVKKTPNRVDFKVPDDLFWNSSGYSIASKGKCKNEVIVNWFVKPKDINVLLQNANQRPSFEYRETLAVFNGDNVSVYRDGFYINEQYLTYYRTPKDIDLAGYKRFDGTDSTTINPELDDFMVEEILERIATKALRNYTNSEQLQVNAQAQVLNKQKQ